MILLDECLLYVEESLAHCAFASPGEDPALQKLAGILSAGVLFESMKRRVADMRKNVKGQPLHRGEEDEDRGRGRQRWSPGGREWKG